MSGLNGTSGLSDDTHSVAQGGQSAGDQLAAAIADRGKVATAKIAAVAKLHQDDVAMWAALDTAGQAYEAAAGKALTQSRAETVERAREAFGRIGSSVEDMTTRVDAIAASVAEIAAGAQKVSTDMSEVAAIAEESSASSEQVSASTQETSASAQQTASSADQLAGTAADLEKLVQRFTLTA